jgi:hypothetical protein
MVKGKTESDIAALPEPTIWARAVLLGTAVLGVAMNDRSLNAKNVDLFGRKVREAAKPVGPVAWALVQALESRAKAIGGNLECDRLRTARSANALCEAVANASTLEIIEVLAHARFETSSSAVQSSLAAAADSLTTLEDPTVVSTLRRLAEMERGDLSASKYLREARAIMQQDEMRRSLPLELRMVVGAAQAYLSTGKQSIVGASAFEATQDYGFTSPSPATGIAKVVAPVDVVIAAKKGSTPVPGPLRAKKEATKRSAEMKTLASEDAPVMTRVNVERRATGLDRKAARELLDEVYREAAEKIDTTNTPMLVSVTLTLDVMRNER